MKLPYKIYSFKWYWLWNRRAQNFRFNARKLFYKTTNFVDDERYKTKSSYAYFYTTITAVVRSVILVGILFAIEKMANNLWLQEHLNAPGWVSYIVELIPKPKYPDDKDAVLYLLSVTASVAGVTLALFYTILATLASTAYAKVQSSIRNLFIYDRDTQAYLRRLTNLTAFSISVLLALSFHYFPGNLVLTILFLYSLTTLFGILKIGMGVYNYFEPSIIARTVVSKINKAIKDSTINGQYWDDKSFQHFNHTNALVHLENLKLITDLCIKGDDLKEASFKSIITSSINVLRLYLHQKRRIPRESLWFPEMLEHKSYFESDMSARAMSRQTHTFIQPQKIQDNFWFEERVISNISFSLENIIINKYVTVFAESVQLLYPLLNDASLSLDMRTGESLLKHLSANLKTVKSASMTPQNIIDYGDWMEYMAAIESYLLAVFYFQFGILQRAAYYNAKTITEEYKKINWGQVDTIYSTDFIPELYEQLDQMNGFVKNEFLVDNIQITPDWYFIQQLTSVHLATIVTKTEQAIVLYKNYILELAGYFDEKGNCLLCSFVAQRGDEFLTKYRYRLAELKTTLNSLDKLEVLKKEYKWVKPDVDKLSAMLDEYEWEGLKYLVKYAERLSVVQWDSKYPDLFSQTYAIIATNINQAFIGNELPKFKALFPAFLRATISGYNTLTKNFQHYAMPYWITYQTLIDLMEISGYAYLYSYLFDDPEYWNVVKTAWDSFFMATEENLKLLLATYAIYKTPSINTGINFGEKHQRQLFFQNVIRALNETDPGKITNADKMIKPFFRVRDFSGLYEVSELFIELYLFTFIGAKNSAQLFRRNLFDHWCQIAEGRKYWDDDDD